MNLQLKFIVLAFSAFTLVSATSSSAPVGGIDPEVAEAASQVLQDRKTAKVDDENMLKLKKELVDVADKAYEVGLGGFVREFSRGCGYVFSKDNMDMVGSFLTRVRKEVPVKMLVASGVLVADSMLTGFVFDKPSQAMVVSGLVCYAWMNLPDVSYYTNSLTTKVGNLLTNSIRAGFSGIFGSTKS